MKPIRLLLTVFLISMSGTIFGQKMALKTNLLDDAILNVNIGAEIGLAPKWTLDVPVSINAWNLSHQRKWKHWYVQPGVRRWFCDRFAGHFVGVHAHGGQYNIGGFDGKINMLGTDFRKLKDSRFQGWFAGAGISYGYSWILGKHWNIEAEIGFGWSYTRYDRFECLGCGRKVESGKSHNYVGPTKAAINVVYSF
ncbi:MAG: DUF3575 domain-containing protein [Muribaculaceae bacterium]|nr:DUF3575 domain-containing protein [Muribaculaceae bacterium]